MSLKIFVCGDVEGHFDLLFQRVASIQKKTGAFDSLFCVGEFFGEDDNSEWELLKSGEIKVPIQTYILGPIRSSSIKYFVEKNGGELCENVTYLGKRGVFTGSSGLQVAYLSGCEVPVGEAANPFLHFTLADIVSLKESLVSLPNFKGIDMLLTSVWPKGVDKYGMQCKDVDANKTGSSLVAQLCLNIRPRYHFCGVEDVNYERQPYRNHRVLQETARHVTRFISLAKVSKGSKKKYLYAFNIVPMNKMAADELIKQPEDATESPFSFENLVSQAQSDKQAQANKPAQFFYDQKMIDRGENRKRRQQGGDRSDGPGSKQPKGPCWFCLGSPEVEKHLVVSVGAECYLALAKGGLTWDHILITPVGHYQSVVSAPTSVGEEILKYKEALIKCNAARQNVTVFFERNFKTHHLQIQAVPVPKRLADSIKDVFISVSKQQGIDLQEVPPLTDLRQVLKAGQPYFWVELPTGERLLHRIHTGFPIQLGREVLAHQSLLNLPHKVDWKNCKQSKEEETQMAKDFRQMFKDFDFSLA